MIPLRIATQNQGSLSARTRAETNLADWRPEQLWLSSHCRDRSVQEVMADAVKTAVNAVLTTATEILPQHELLRVLRYRRREVAWLRLAARVLRGPSSTATFPSRNLAASALFVAAVRHSDLLATVEFAAEATGHAVMLEVDLVAGEVTLPPNVATVSQLANRMRRRGRELLAHRLTWPDLDTIGPCLGRALAEDSLRGLDELAWAGGK